jgi:phospholipid/cholesterol/gamma-HCH transport system permease protein
VLKRIARLGALTIEFCQQLGQSGLFLFRAMVSFPRFSQVWMLLSNQLYRIGVLSIVIIALSGLFIGMVVALQGYNTLQKFGAESELGSLLALAVVRELGPVVSALLFAGRAGSSLTAELGLMRTTRQISSLEMMAVDPYRYVVSPRLWAGFIALPLLTILFNLVAVYGGYLVGVSWLGVDAGSFWSNMQDSVSFQTDIVNGVIKSLVFGLIITWIAVYQGFYSQSSASGISHSTTKTVVYASLIVLVLDFVLTAIMMGGW